MDNVAQLLADNAEKFELNQDKFIEFINTHGKDAVREAVSDVDWKTVIGSYSNKALRRVRGSSPNIQFNKPQRVYMLALVRAEQSFRNKDLAVPSGHGMAADGTQQ